MDAPSQTRSEAAAALSEMSNDAEEFGDNIGRIFDPRGASERRTRTKERESGVTDPDRGNILSPLGKERG